MRREGRQHGMVRTYPTPSVSGSRSRLNELSSASTAGIFTRVTTKPTNHSKFTGKCGRRKCEDCHVIPARKSKDKVKGAQKMRTSSEVLITSRVVDALPGFNVSGFKSATAVLHYLDDHRDHHHHNDDHDDVDDDVASYDHHEIEEIDVVYHDDVDDEDEDEDIMSFCEVGVVWQEIDGDESWCFVEEM